MQIKKSWSWMSSRQLVLVITWRWWCVKWNFVCSTFYSISGLYSVLEYLQCIRLVTWPIDMKFPPWICGWFAMIWHKEYMERRHSEPFKFLFLPKMGLLASQANTRKNSTDELWASLELFFKKVVVSTLKSWIVQRFLNRWTVH